MAKRELLEHLNELLEIPTSYYEKAVARYRSLGEWFCRDESCLAQFDPSVYPQGSFRLGTVIRPLFPSEEYDLDVVCELLKLQKQDITQKKLKEVVGGEVKSYSKAQGIKEPVRERTRCWRLAYADEVSFHIDILSCLPEDERTVAVIIGLGVDPRFAQRAIALTCQKHMGYEVITSDWPKSNPAGYAAWFEERMEVPADEQRKGLVARGLYESVNEVPAYALKTPLQRSVQLLKRHRDVMFQKHPKVKPISMILTTLSGEAYGGERDLGSALAGILERMPSYVRSDEPRVPNPVNPGEDFANKWKEDPRLEENFRLWHTQASRDFEKLAMIGASDAQKILEERLHLRVGEDELRRILGSSAATASVAPTIAVATGPKPWRLL